MSTQFLIDENGKKTAALIPIEEYNELMEDLEDLAAIAEQRDDEGIPFEDVVKKLFPNGLPSADFQEV